MIRQKQRIVDLLEPVYILALDDLYEWALKKPMIDGLADAVQEALVLKTGDQKLIDYYYNLQEMSHYHEVSVKEMIGSLDPESASYLYEFCTKWGATELARRVQKAFRF